MDDDPLILRLREGVARCIPDWSDAGRIGIAVSGGPDSLGLLLLAARAFAGRVEAATVDHGLRAESADEAAFVAAACAELEVPHRVLGPAAPVPGNRQASARDARYRLLDGWAVERALTCVATAHHVEDQAETLLMRLARGSGVAGLSGVRRRNVARHVPVIRPVLDWRRSELAMVVHAAGLIAVDDPSNRDDRYARSRVRERLAEDQALDPVALARSAAALAEAEEALEWTTRRLAGDRLRPQDGGFSLDAAGLPPELLRRLVRLALIEAGGAPEPRGSEITRLVVTLSAGRAATLAGISCRPGVRWHFAPAPPRR